LVSRVGLLGGARCPARRRSRRAAGGREGWGWGRPAAGGGPGAAGLGTGGRLDPPVGTSLSHSAEMIASNSACSR